MKVLRHFFQLFVLMTAACSDPTPTGLISTISFVPETVQSSGGVCSVQAVVSPPSDFSVTLVTLVAHVIDPTGETITMTQGTEELDDEFNSIVVPGRGAVEGDLSFDLSGSTLQFPVDVQVVLVGAGQDGVVQFIGSFECEAP